MSEPGRDRYLDFLAEAAIICMQSDDPLDVMQLLVGRLAHLFAAYVAVFTGEAKTTLTRLVDANESDTLPLALESIRVGEGIIGWALLQRQTLIHPATYITLSGSGHYP